MELLRRRRFWTGAGLFLLVAGGLAAYAFPPWPSPLNWVFDLLAFTTTFAGGLMIISQFVLPVQTELERRKVFDHLMNFASGTTGPILFVKDGKMVGRKEELRRYGHGVALVDPVSAVVIERAAALRWRFPLADADARSRPGGARAAGAGPALVRAAGPGIVFIAPGERIVATLDLRRQSRGTSAEGLTRDGIECGAHISVTFGLDPDPDRRAPAEAGAAQPYERVERNLPAFPFNAGSAFRAVYGVALGEKQAVEWTDLPLMVAVERYRDVLSEYRLDDLFQSTRPDFYPFADFVARVTRVVKDAPVLRERGLIVYSVGIGDLKLPREVVNQRIRSWQARWQKATIQQEAAAETQAMRTESRWQAEAQQMIFKDIQQLLGATEDPVARKALSLMLIKALQRAAADPHTRQRLPADAMRTLESLGEWAR
jgi:regulator of protease activity HflC (stomatin/prohibitin superfamily)